MLPLAMVNTLIFHHEFPIAIRHVELTMIVTFILEIMSVIDSYGSGGLLYDINLMLDMVFDLFQSAKDFNNV